MQLRDWNSILVFSALFFILACAAIVFMFTKQEVVDGKLVDLRYTVEYSETFTNKNGVSGVVELPKDHFLMIEVKGKVASYKVGIDTYLRALSGQTIFKMLCNPFSCSVIE